jgi:hypothetical protein
MACANLQGTVAGLQQQVAALQGELQQLVQQAEQLGGWGRQMLAQRTRAERIVTQLQVRQIQNSSPVSWARCCSLQCVLICC